MDDQVIVTGGGMAGLTAAAYLVQAGHKVLLFEKEAAVGGLVNSFHYKGFVFDGGIRAVENSGIVLPMLRQLGIDIPLIRNGVSIGIEDAIVHLRDKDSLDDYLRLLQDQFPESAPDVRRFGAEIRKIMQYMDILYGIDNPLFLDLMKDKEYLVKTILPWLFKYLLTIRKVTRLDMPVAEYLGRISANQALIDMIAQHFFKDTPTFFALSYFSLYLDYQYPVGGTGVLSDRMKQFILDHHGEIRCGTEIVRIDLEKTCVFDQAGNAFPYRKLIWCADQKAFYRAIDEIAISKPKVRQAVAARKRCLQDKTGGDSILTLYLTVDLDPAYFAGISQPHFFYTPQKAGLSRVSPKPPARPGESVEADDSRAVLDWIRQYLEHTTYEIACPVLRDKRLAPPGQTGLIVSALFDYDLVRQIETTGWYEAFKTFCARTMIRILKDSVYPALEDKVIDSFVATPLTLARRTGNSDGAITGWAFTNSEMPAVHTMTKIAKSILTGLPDVYQAGQWTFSPSGLPISILTGKMAADRVSKELRKAGQR